MQGGGMLHSVRGWQASCLKLRCGGVMALAWVLAGGAEWTQPPAPSWPQPALHRHRTDPTITSALTLRQCRPSLTHPPTCPARSRLVHPDKCKHPQAVDAAATINTVRGCGVM